MARETIGGEREEDRPERAARARALDERRRLLVVAVLAKIEAFAKRAAGKLAGAIEREELMGVAREGLVHAASLFDPDVPGTNERTFFEYAWCSVRGAMVNAFDKAIQAMRFRREAYRAFAKASDQLASLCLVESEDPATVGGLEDIQDLRNAYAVQCFRSWAATAEGARTPEQRITCAIFELAERALPPEEAELVRLRFDEELSVAEMAARAETSESTMRRRLDAALLQLRVGFEEAGYTANDLLAMVA